MSQKLGCDFEMFNKACHVCGSFDHLQKECNYHQRKFQNHKGNPQQDLKDKRVIDSGCSRHMTGKRSYLIDYKEINGGFVAFGGNSKAGKITRKGKIRTGKLDFEDVYFVKELKFNLFSVSQMCDKKNSVLFTDTACVVQSPAFKLTDESYVLLKVPRNDNMYTFDLKNVVPQGGLTYLFAKAASEEYNLWHRRLRHGIKREFSIARTSQQNGVAERKNKTLIGAARTMLADLKLPTTFWAEAVNTACYVQNRVLVIKPHNKTPYELFLGRKPALSFMRLFRFLVTILNTIDHLGKFNGKADEGFFGGYSNNRKAFRVFNSRTKIVEENLRVKLTGSKSRPPMLNKENYIPWSSRLLRYAKSRPNGKLIYNSILNGPYIRKMIPKPGDANCDINITETSYLQTDDELSDKELKQIEDDDQVIQTILLGLPKDIYAAVDSYETAQEIWFRERFTSNKGESIESYYHRFLKLMNDLKRNKHFPEKIASNLKFLNNLQLEWSRHVTIIHQTKDLHTTDYTQLYDFLKYNQKESKIHIDNESIICIVKNPIFHSKTKHIEIKHHFIRDSNEKKLIQMIKIHTDNNVADLLTKAFDVSRFQYLIASIGMLNLRSHD
nr:ribonuclease H-like domain-containing protein [Tanacetum cinerariifolium]